MAAAVEERLRAVAVAIRALEGDWGGQRGGYVCTPAIFNPLPEVIDYALAHEVNRHGDTIWVDFEGVRYSIHDIPADRLAEPKPLPACLRCGSTACPDECPCGTRAAVGELDVIDATEWF